MQGVGLVPRPGMARDRRDSTSLGGSAVAGRLVVGPPRPAGERPRRSEHAQRRPNNPQLPLPSGDGFPGGNFFVTFLVNTSVPVIVGSWMFLVRLLREGQVEP